jgi:hypothetical protein
MRLGAGWKRVPLAGAVAGDVLLSGMAAAAEQRTLRLGELELAYDAARWRAEPIGENSVAMQPISATGGKRDPVMVDRTPVGESGCTHLAPRKLAAGPYEEPTATAAEVDNRPAIRLTAHSRGRNAMPRGTVICAEHRGAAYMLSATRPGCRSGGRNLFSGIDPLQELADGVRFLP